MKTFEIPSRTFNGPPVERVKPLPRVEVLTDLPVYMGASAGVFRRRYKVWSMDICEAMDATPALGTQYRRKSREGWYRLVLDRKTCRVDRGYVVVYLDYVEEPM